MDDAMKKVIYCIRLFLSGWRLRWRQDELCWFAPDGKPTVAFNWSWAWMAEIGYREWEKEGRNWREIYKKKMDNKQHDG